MLINPTASYADLLVVSVLHMFKLIHEGEVYDRIAGFHPSIGKLYRACEPWLKKNN
jgi:hypothetical protein